MYCDFLNEKDLKKFASIYFEYSESVLESISVEVINKTKDQIQANIYAHGAYFLPIHLGVLSVDDFTCIFTVDKNEKMNNDMLRLNGNYPHFHYSQYWRQFLTTKLEAKYGQDTAEDYIEAYLSTNFSSLQECQKLFQIAYKRADYNPHEPVENEREKE